MSDSSNTQTDVARLASQKHGLPNKQAGLGFIGIFALVAMLLFVGMFAFKVVPNYVEFMTVKKIAADAQNNADLMKSPKSKVMSAIGQAYRTNSVWDLKPDDTIVLLKDGRTGYKITVKYEKRAKLFHNIYVVTSFEEEAGAI